MVQTVRDRDCGENLEHRGRPRQEAGSLVEVKDERYERKHDQRQRVSPDWITASSPGVRQPNEREQWRPENPECSSEESRVEREIH